MTAEVEQRETPLAGLRVALAGRLASLSRNAAAELIVRNGGTFSPTVTKATNLLVIGGNGWPLRRNGRPSRKLARAESLRRQGRAVEVIAEEEFLRRLGLLPTEPILSLHPLPAMAEMVGVSRRRLESWLRWGFLAPAQFRENIPLFDYAGVAAARSTADLLAAGIEPRRIALSLLRLRAWLSDRESAGATIARLSLATGCLALPTDDGRWVEPHGQLLFDYAAPDHVSALPLRHFDEHLYESALAQERNGDFQSAAELYQRLLESGPDADVCLNLGNVLYALGRPDAAAERFRQSVELDPTLAEAWNNLGNCLGDLGHADEAVRAFRRAVATEPDYALAWENLGSLLDDAGESDGAAQAYRQALAIEPDNADSHRALATVLEDAGLGSEARHHWREYVEREPNGDWAEYARSRLNNNQRA